MSSNKRKISPNRRAVSGPSIGGPAAGDERCGVQVEAWKRIIILDYPRWRWT